VQSDDDWDKTSSEEDEEDQRKAKLGKRQKNSSDTKRSSKRHKGMLLTVRSLFVSFDRLMASWCSN
jgi:hypothetical protein